MEGAVAQRGSFFCMQKNKKPDYKKSSSLCKNKSISKTNYCCDSPAVFAYFEKKSIKPKQLLRNLIAHLGEFTARWIVRCHHPAK